MEIHPRVRPSVRADLHPEMEVLEIVLLDRAVIEEVGTGTVHHEKAVLNGESRGVFVDLPTIEVLAVE
jgi:hypothetical protein